MWNIVNTKSNFAIWDIFARNFLNYTDPATIPKMVKKNSGFWLEYFVLKSQYPLLHWILILSVPDMSYIIDCWPVCPNT